MDRGIESFTMGFIGRRVIARDCAWILFTTGVDYLNDSANHSAAASCRGF